MPWLTGSTGEGRVFPWSYTKLLSCSRDRVHDTMTVPNTISLPLIAWSTPTIKKCMDTTCQCPFSLHACTHTHQTMTVHSPFIHQTSHTDVQAYLAHQKTHLKS